MDEAGPSSALRTYQWLCNPFHMCSASEDEETSLLAEDTPLLSRTTSRSLAPTLSLLSATSSSSSLSKPVSRSSSISSNSLRRSSSNGQSPRPRQTPPRSPRVGSNEDSSPPDSPLLEETPAVEGNTSNHIYQIPAVPVQQGFTETARVNVRVDEEGYKLVNEYLLIKTLGRGSSSKVKLCLNTLDNELYAMKICHRSTLLKRRRARGTAMDQVLREISILRQLNHPNIVALKQVIIGPTAPFLYMIFEYMELGPVMVMNRTGDSQLLEDEALGIEPNCSDSPSPERPEKLELDLARKYFCDVLEGLQYLHQRNIVHADIKPENLLVSTEGVAKLIDFGSAYYVASSESTTEIKSEEMNDDYTDALGGTPAFFAPELCAGTGGAERHTVVSGFARDVWALGASLYCMGFGCLPFPAENLIDLFHQIVNEPLAMPFALDPAYEDLVRGMLAKDPDVRLTLAQIREHPWVVAGNSKTMAEIVG